MTHNWVNTIRKMREFYDIDEEDRCTCNPVLLEVGGRDPECPVHFGKP